MRGVPFGFAALTRSNDTIGIASSNKLEQVKIGSEGETTSLIQPIDRMWALAHIDHRSHESLSTTPCCHRIDALTFDHRL